MPAPADPGALGVGLPEDWPAALAQLDADGRVLAANRAWREQPGLPARVAVQPGAEALTVWHLLPEGVCWALDVQPAAHGGWWCTALRTSAPPRPAPGGFSSRFESELRYWTIFHASSSPILLVGEEGQILEANPAATGLYCYPRELMLQMELAQLMPACPSPARLFATQPETLPAGLHLRQGAESFMAEATLSYVRLRGVLMAVVLVRDVHEAHMRAALEQHQQRELAHAARLIHAGEMASALAHELNQPLTAIRNFSGVVQRRLEQMGDAARTVREPVQMIAEQALRAGEIVHRIRGFVRKGVPVTAPLNLNEVVRDVIRFNEADARAHGVEIQVLLAEDLPRLNADRLQLEQAISNLVRNGIESMLELPGQRLLRISSSLTVDQQLELRVSDQGGGLAPALAHDPFAPFVTTKPHGMGLGLAICRTIIENHGGRIWVANNSARGCTFCFSLPLPTA
ncbi:ATP-binding protein [Zoogloea sp.]|uniref:PAS domain-containing sensor histidine kinase n=1 Tax=Zoogloea sp. TaxID=49181 RepID=UPI0035B2A153